MSAQLLAPLARAAPTGGATANGPTAQALFDEAKQLMNAGKFEAACVKFQTSQDIEPTTGTLFRLADCYERIGKTATAWSHFLTVAAEASAAGPRGKAGEEEARRRARALEAVLAKLLIVPPRDAPPGLVIRRGTVNVPDGAWGAAIPVDLGVYRVVATAPHRVTWTADVDMRQPGRLVTLSVPHLANEASREPAGALAPMAMTQPARSSAWPVAGWSAVGAGALGVGIGVAFGLVSLRKHQESTKDGGCDTSNVCAPNAYAARTEAIQAGNVATVAVISGVVAVAAGIVILVVTPANAAPSRGARAVLGDGIAF